MVAKHLSVAGIVLSLNLLGISCVTPVAAQGVAGTTPLAVSLPIKTSLEARASRPLSDFTVTPFTSKEGAPADVNWLAQTPDGFLWLSTSTGLVRFDGVSFERNLGNALPDESVSTLFVDTRGELWVGFEDGRIARRTNGVFTEVDQGLPKEGRIIWSIVSDGEGTLWTTSGYGIYRFNGSVWTEVGRDIGASPDSVYGLAGVLDDGRLFVASSKNVWFQVKGTEKFEAGDMNRVWKSKFGFDYTELPASIASNKIREIVGYPNGVSLRLTSKDSMGAIWSVGDGAERFRWAASSSGDRQLLFDKISYTAMIYMLYLDREGNVWSAETDGIHRLRPNKFSSPFPRDAMAISSLIQGKNNNVWIVPTQVGDVYDIDNGVEKKWDSLGRGFASASSDKRGDIIFLKDAPESKEDDIRILQNGQVTHIPYPNGVSGRVAEDMLDDPSGGYLLVTTLGLYRYQNGSWGSDQVYKDLPKDPPLQARSDRYGRVWVMYTNNRVALIDKGRTKVFSSVNGLEVGEAWSVYVGPKRTWIAGRDGIAYLDGDRFVSITPSIRSNGNLLKRITDVIEASDGDLWMNADAGVAHISESEINQFVHTSNYRPTADIFDEEDGLQGGISTYSNGPTLLLDNLNRLWVSRAAGISWMDLDHIPRNPVPPKVFFTLLDADGKQQPSLSGISLSAHTRMVRIDYTAPSLSMPDRVRFRVKLKGFDSDWHDVGTSRSATYTNLGPGTYKLLVRASNEDGVWSEDDASLPFTIAPAFYQTLWFRTLAGVVVLFLCWAIFSLRLRQIQSKLRLQLSAKHHERERIARELHDTLMQGTHGLVLQVQSWSEDPSIKEDRRRDMERAANLAGSLLVEGRDRISEMRNASDQDVDLLKGLRDVCADCSAVYPISFSVTQEGVPRFLEDDNAREILNIGREAVRNAFMHSKASEILVHLHYGMMGLRLVVLDDGIGIPAEMPQADSSSHWGIIGMKERATRMGFSLIIRRREKGGTEFVLEVPSALFYRVPMGRFETFVDAIRSKLNI